MNSPSPFNTLEDGTVVKLAPEYRAAYKIDLPKGVERPCKEMTVSLSLHGLFVGKMLITALAPATMFWAMSVQI
jgi:hypothetical protein